MQPDAHRAAIRVPINRGVEFDSYMADHPEPLGHPRTGLRGHSAPAWPSCICFWEVPKNGLAA